MILGSFCGPKSMKNQCWEASWGQGRFWRSKKPSAALVLGGQVGAVLGLSRLLAASWSLKKRLEASRGGLEPLFFRAKFQADFEPHFTSILDPNMTPKSLKNQQKSMPTRILKRSLISKPLASKIQDDLILKLKRPVFKKYWKTRCFGALFTS